MKLTRLTVSATLALALLAAPLAVEAQPAGKIYRIGWLSNDRYPPGDDAFQRGLRDLGWVEGRNVIIEYRFVHEQPMPMPMARIAFGLAADLVALKVDLIVVVAGPARFRQGCDQHDSDRIRGVRRSCSARARHQPRATWRKPHGAHQHWHGTDRKKAATASRTQSRGSRASRFS